MYANSCSLARRALAALISAGLLAMPAVGSGSYQQALGTVTEADRASIGGASIVTGTAVYAGDVMQTDNQGALRLRLGQGQLYLSASSSASLEEHAGLASVTLAKGSATFALPDPAQFELETPAGTLRGAGTKATRGEVAIHNDREIVVTASHGDLVLDNDGDFHTIAEGKTYRIVIEDDSNSSSQDSHASGAPKNTRHRKRKLLFFLVAGGVLVAAAVPLWIHYSESNYK